jgi:hypothetical protein
MGDGIMGVGPSQAFDNNGIMGVGPSQAFDNKGHVDKKRA